MLKRFAQRGEEMSLVRKRGVRYSRRGVPVHSSQKLYREDRLLEKEGNLLLRKTIKTLSAGKEGGGCLLTLLEGDA